MGYESKIYVVNKHKPVYGTRDWDEVIAKFDLCKMGYSTVDGVYFRDLFTEPVGCLYADDGNTELTEDCYGDPIEGAPIRKVIYWLYKWLKENDYNRAKVFYKLLKSMAKEIDGNLWCYHYGY